MRQAHWTVPPRGSTYVLLRRRADAAAAHPRRTYAVPLARGTAYVLVGRAQPVRVGSVAVVLRLVRAGDVDAEVLGLALGQLGEPDAEGVEVQARDLLVEVLRQRVDLLVVVAGLREELDLGDRLVAEASCS